MLLCDSQDRHYLFLLLRHFHGLYMLNNYNAHYLPVKHIIHCDKQLVQDNSDYDKLQVD